MTSIAIALMLVKKHKPIKTNKMKNYVITHKSLFLFQTSQETEHGATFTNHIVIAQKFTKEEAERIANFEGYGVREV